MNSKVINSVIWTMVGLIGLMFIGNGVLKLSGSQQAYDMASRVGISIHILKVLGIMEILFAILSVIPRTGILGFLLLSAYMGGAIATHVITGESILFPLFVQAFIWITAIVRFQELRKRLLKQ